jgi:hypothetical protein
MKQLLLACCAALAVTFVNVSAEPSLLRPAQIIPPTNPQASVFQFVGATEVEVAYSRPGMKGRKVFGALVPFDQVWRTGADNATRIRFSTAVKVEGADVPPGTYELFTIPRAGRWTVMLQNMNQQWGSYAYDSENDVARMDVTPARLQQPVETFTIGFGDLTARSAIMNIDWDRTRVPVRIEVDVVAQVVPQIEAAMQADEKKPYFRAAMFYYENGLDIDKAAEWITAAVAANPQHIGMLHRQALILAKQGNKTGALEAARTSLAGAATSPPELKAEYTRLTQALIERLTARGAGK